MSLRALMELSAASRVARLQLRRTSIPEPEQDVPDYDFPITYHIITRADMQHLPTLNAYINMQTDTCNQISANGVRGVSPMGHPAASFAAFLENDKQVCVLYMRWDAVRHLEAMKRYDQTRGALQQTVSSGRSPLRRTASELATLPLSASYITALTDLNFLNSCVLGHSKVKRYDPRDKPSSLAIYNFCKHHLTITETMGELTGVAARRGLSSERGLGVPMITALMTAIAFLPGNMSQGVENIWLGIDLRNQMFEPVLKIYTTAGFKNPFITNMDIDGTVMPFSILQLTRGSLGHVNSQIVAESNFHQAMNLVYKFRNPTQSILVRRPSGHPLICQSNVVEYHCTFDPVCLSHLHLYPFLSFNEQRQAQGLHGFEELQRETSGELLAINSLLGDRGGHDVLALKTMTGSTEAATLFEYVVGEIGSVLMELGEMTFHTHPIVNYRIHETSIGPPSREDFLSFVQSFVRLVFQNKSFKFSMVLTVEGIHTVSFSPAGIDRIVELMNHCAASGFDSDETVRHVMSEMNEVTHHYEYDFANRPYDWERYGHMSTKHTERLKALTDQYSTWFNRINRLHGEFFHHTFSPWQDIKPGWGVKVVYLENRIKIAPLPPLPPAP